MPQTSSGSDVKTEGGKLCSILNKAEATILAATIPLFNTERKRAITPSLLNHHGTSISKRTSRMVPGFLQHKPV
jgi:hypothetical protein